MSHEKTAYFKYLKESYKAYRSDNEDKNEDQLSQIVTKKYAEGSGGIFTNILNSFDDEKVIKYVIVSLLAKLKENNELNYAVDFFNNYDGRYRGIIAECFAIIGCYKELSPPAQLLFGSYIYTGLTETEQYLGLSKTEQYDESQIRWDIVGSKNLDKNTPTQNKFFGGLAQGLANLAVINRWGFETATGMQKFSASADNFYIEYKNRHDSSVILDQSGTRKYIKAFILGLMQHKRFDLIFAFLNNHIDRPASYKGSYTSFIIEIYKVVFHCIADGLIKFGYLYDPEITLKCLLSVNCDDNFYLGEEFGLTQTALIREYTVSRLTEKLRSRRTSDKVSTQLKNCIEKISEISELAAEIIEVRDNLSVDDELAYIWAEFSEEERIKLLETQDSNGQMSDQESKTHEELHNSKFSNFYQLEDGKRELLLQKAREQNNDEAQEILTSLHREHRENTYHNNLEGKAWEDFLRHAIKDRRKSFTHRGGRNNSFKTLVDAEVLTEDDKLGVNGSKFLIIRAAYKKIQEMKTESAHKSGVHPGLFKIAKPKASEEDNNANERVDSIISNSML